MDTTPTKSKGSLQFRQEWELKFALHVSTRDPSTHEVTSALCLMCRNFGRENHNDDSRKRRRTANYKFFCSPWRTDNFRRHLTSQHPSKWKDYEELSNEDKLVYFTQKESTKLINTKSNIQPEASMKARTIAEHKFTFIVDKDIIEDIIGNLLFDSHVGCAEEKNTIQSPSSRMNALKCFVYNEEDEIYNVVVKSVLEMNIFVKHIALGISFNQATRLYQSLKEETSMGILGSASDLDVAQHCRIVCAVNLQRLKELFKNVWAFAIGIDARNNSGTAYLDIRIRCYFRKNLQNFHLLAIPMRERQTGEYQFDHIVSVLDILAPNWRYQMIGIASEGASSTMTGCIPGICTRLTRECHLSLFRSRCGAHELDLVMIKAFSKLCSGHFLETLTAMTGHLRRQQNLMTDMNSTCPLFVSTRWISIGKVLKWLKEKRLRLLVHFEEKKPRCTPSIDWWTVVCIIQPLVERVEKTFVALQGMNTLVCEQRQLLSKLVYDLMERMNVEGPMTAEERIEFTAVVENNPYEGFIMENYHVKWHKMIDALDEVEEFVQVQMDGLRENEMEQTIYESIVTTAAVFALQVITGAISLVAERDAQNIATDELPPAFPIDLCKVNVRQFSAALQQQRNRLKHSATDEEILRIDQQFRDLRIAFREEEGLRHALENAHSYMSIPSFPHCWSPLGDRCRDLQRYCGAIASVMPSTNCVESDFSLINWTKDPHSKQITDFALESILHCKQHEKLLNLFDN